MKGYVYALRGGPEDLQGCVQALGQPLYHWVADGVQLTMGQGLPKDWKEQGAVFGSRGELRWWWTETNYQALLLTDELVDGLEPLPGEWTAKEETFFLQDLNDRRLNPNFLAYPHGGPNGRFKALVYYHDGTATFISPKELLTE